jgi:hypothetical protein
VLLLNKCFFCCCCCCLLRYRLSPENFGYTLVHGIEIMFNPGSRWKRVVSFTLWPLYPQGKSSYYPVAHSSGSAASTRDLQMLKRIITMGRRAWTSDRFVTWCNHADAYIYMSDPSHSIVGFSEILVGSWELCTAFAEQPPSAFPLSRWCLHTSALPLASHGLCHLFVLVLR